MVPCCQSRKRRQTNTHQRAGACTTHAVATEAVCSRHFMHKLVISVYPLGKCFLFFFFPDSSSCPPTASFWWNSRTTVFERGRVLLTIAQEYHFHVCEILLKPCRFTRSELFLLRSSASESCCFVWRGCNNNKKPTLLYLKAFNVTQTTYADSEGAK